MRILLGIYVYALDLKILISIAANFTGKRSKLARYIPSIMGLLSNLCILLSFFNLNNALLNARVNVSDCSSPDALFNLTNATFVPDTGRYGNNSTLLLSMDVPYKVDNGTASYTVAYGRGSFRPIKEIVCSKVDCPILPGSLSTSLTYPIPSYLAGPLNVTIRWEDLSHKELICVRLSIVPGNLGKEVSLYLNSFPKKLCPYYSNASYIRAVKNA